MLLLLSPAKSLDFETPLPPGLPHSKAQFTAQAAELIHLLQPLAPQQVARLMDLSDKLAQLNVARYGAWSARCTAANSRQAVLAFNGDVYDSLDALSLTAQDLDWAQAHLCILSGLYGVLRPLDRMQPYRLEMGTALANPRGKDLYAFWGRQIAEYLNGHLSAQRQRVVVNLASQEYFKAVQTQALQARVVECVFEDFKGGRYKIISFYAKRARGLMARYAIQQRVRRAEQLQGFDLDGYAFAADASSGDRWVFRRRLAA